MEKNNKTFIVDGQILSEEEFLTLKSDTQCKLIQLQENQYKKLQKLEG